MSATSDDQVAFVRAALREEFGDTLATEDIDRAARIGAAATMSWLIAATRDGRTGGTVVEVNADDPLRGT